MTYTNYQREVVLRIIDGYPDPMLPRNVWMICNQPRANDVLHWLINNRVTGANFIDMLRQQNNTILDMYAEIVKRVDRDVVKKPLIAGKTWRL